MDRRSFVKFVSTSAIAATASGEAFADNNKTPLNDESRKEFEKLLAPQLDRTQQLLQLNTLNLEPANTFERVKFWNYAALEITSKDHTPLVDLPPGGDPATRPDKRRFGEQLGPHRSAYAMAVTHIALFEAINAFTKKYTSFTAFSPTVPSGASLDAAIAQATHDALVHLYPFKSNDIDSVLASDIGRIEGSEADIKNGQVVGQNAARSIIDKRQDDGTAHQEIKFSDLPADAGPGKWSIDPISKIETALGAKWPGVKPFLLNSGSQFRLPMPPALTDAKYVKAFNEVKDIGRNGDFPADTSRRDGEKFKAIFWAYDGTPNLCAPPRLYNQVIRTLSEVKQITDPTELARLFALCNTAMADAAIAAWDSKYHWRFWRPVTGIRSTFGGGDPSNEPDADWEPLGAPDTNTRGPNFTPPFPAYPSGHATFGGALFQVMRRVYPDDHDKIAFVLVSDEFNGKNRGVNDKKPRPLLPLPYVSLLDAEFENAFSRIWMGVHWRFDGDDGIKLGNQVGDWAYDHGFAAV